MSDKTKLWIGFDLDGTLAHYEKWLGAGWIGEPIPYMVEKLKQLNKKYNIRIFTARVGSAYPEQIEESKIAITDWCKRHLGAEFPITSEKDQHMITCFDDRSKQVVSNTGLCLEDELVKIVREYELKTIDVYQLRDSIIKLSKAPKV
jgi:hypothetical protein